MDPSHLDERVQTMRSNTLCYTPPKPTLCTWTCWHSRALGNLCVLLVANTRPHGTAQLHQHPPRPKQNQKGANDQQPSAGQT